MKERQIFPRSRGNSQFITLYKQKWLCQEYNGDLIKEKSKKVSATRISIILRQDYCLNSFRNWQMHSDTTHVVLESVKVKLILDEPLCWRSIMLHFLLLLKLLLIHMGQKRAKLYLIRDSTKKLGKRLLKGLKNS